MASRCPKCDKTVYFGYHDHSWRCQFTVTGSGKNRTDVEAYRVTERQWEKFSASRLHAANCPGGKNCVVQKRGAPEEGSNTPDKSIASLNRLLDSFRVTDLPTSLGEEAERCWSGGAMLTEKVSSLGKDWHKFCLKCERCNKTLTAGGHAEHDGKPYCHKPCYATLFGPKGVNIGGAGSYIYDKPQAEGQLVPGPVEYGSRAEEKKVSAAHKGPSKASSITTFTGEPNICPRCSKKVYFAEKVTSLGKDWHRPCLRCERCGKTLTPGSHAEHDGQPYCHKPCYGILFGPKGVNTGAVGSYIYDKDPEAKDQP